MAFDLQMWQRDLKQRLVGWHARWVVLRDAGTARVYPYLAAAALWPVVEAVRGGDWGALAVLGGVLADVGTNLLANQIQAWKDEADAARNLAEAVDGSPDLRGELDAVLTKLDVVAQARAALPEGERAWFERVLREELARLGNLARYEAVLTGSGAAAQGPGAVAAGQDGVAVGGNVGGDVLGTGARKEVHHHSSDQKRREEEALDCYLRNVQRLCNALPLAALAEEEKPHHRAEVTLNRVYISLNTTTRVSLLEKDDASQQEELFRRREDRPLPALAAAAQEVRLVILGDPGSGKSTFVNYLAYLLAGCRLGEIDLPEAWSHGALLPIRVILRELVAYLPAESELAGLSAKKRQASLLEGIWSYLRDELATVYRAEEAQSALERAVNHCDAVIIFDGLDEVSQERRAIVREAVEGFCRLCGESRVIVTCRVRSYQGEARLSGFVDVTLDDFDEAQVSDFVERWYKALGVLGALTPVEAERRAQNLRMAVEPLMDLARNPLLLTTMAVVHTAQVELPRQRAKLYERCIKVLLRRWHQHKAGEIPLLKRLEVSEQELLAGLWEVAYEAHQEVGVGETGDLPRSEVLRSLVGRLGSYARAEQFLDYVDARAGLLVGRGGAREPVYSFPHRTFQEYLAGCHLALGGRDFGRRLRGLLRDEDRWALVVRLGAEHLVHNAGDVYEVLDAAYALCPVREPEGEADWRGVLWAGYLAAELGRRRFEGDTEERPDGGTAFVDRLIPRLCRVLRGDWLGALERAEAGEVLARLGDPRFRADAWYLPDEELLGFVEVPAGPFVMGTQAEEILTLLERFGGDRDWYERETPQHGVTLPEYYIARYPVTQAQYRAFVQETGHSPPAADIDSERPYEWVDGCYPPQRANQPVVLVTWHDALAYCAWLTKRLRAWEGTPEPLGRLLREEGWCVTLPSEPQWEKAARGGDGRWYPWGDELDPERANYGDTGIGTTSAVGVFPDGASPYGVEDMSGNVWEWTRSLWGEDLGTPEFGYPYDPSDGREDLTAGDGVLRVLRGGAFYYEVRFVRAASRNWFNPLDRYGDYGFRVVVVSPVSLCNLDPLDSGDSG